MSRALRPSGPTWSRVNVAGIIPYTDVRPYVGLSPVAPFESVGLISDPEVEEPSENAVRRAIGAQPEPPDAPLGVVRSSSGDHALRVVITPAGVVGRPLASGPIASCPREIAPAAFIRAANVEA